MKRKESIIILFFVIFVGFVFLISFFQEKKKMGEEVIIYEPAVCNGCTYYLKPSKDEINLYREDGRLIRTFASESSIKYSAAQDSYYYILGQKLFVYHLENDEDVLIDELDFNDYSISLAIDDYLLLSLDHQPFLYDLNDHSIWEIQKNEKNVFMHFIFRIT